MGDTTSVLSSPFGPVINYQVAGQVVTEFERAHTDARTCTRDSEYQDKADSIDSFRFNMISIYFLIPKASHVPVSRTCHVTGLI